MANFLIGQDNEISVQIDGITYTSFAITSHELTYKLTIKEVGILGDTTQRLDEVFMGISGSLECKVNDPDMFNVLRIIVDRAQRRKPPYPRVTIKSQYTFPNDQRRALIVVPDVKFGDIPLGSTSREEHVTLKLAYGAERAPVNFI